MGIFGKGSGGGASRGEAQRLQRHSSGWMELSKFVSSRPSLRVLDIGPTSSTNINLVTELGHSIYMANLVEEANQPEWSAKSEDGAEEEQAYAVDRFIAANLTFAGRRFDVVLLWDTLDYVPEALAQPIVNRLCEVMEPEGHLLAMFHGKANPEENAFSRYHLTNGPTLDVQRAGSFPLRTSYSNRQVEVMFKDFASYRFFLAKDALREVIVKR